MSGAELAVMIVAPAEDRAVFRRRAGEGRAGGHLDAVTEAGDGDRLRQTAHRSLAQLAAAVLPPAEDLAVEPHGAGVLRPGRDGHRIDHDRDQGWLAHGAGRTAGVASQLPLAVVAPAADGPGAHRAGV
jgi:hypothetical protein